VGGGVAGLRAADELVAAGCGVVVVEKSRGVGGRMATRRLGDAVLDHGAQFFTVRGDSFGGIVSAAVEAGRVARWTSGFAQAESINAEVVPADDGHPRYRGAGGMTDLPKFLLERLGARGVALRTGARVTAIALDGESVRLEIDGAEAIRFAGCVVTAPVPQALDLFAAGGLPAPGLIDGDARRRLAAVAYDPCFALMLVLDRPSRVPPPGGIQCASGPISWLADNHLKGISPVPALTVHASGAFSRERFDDAPDAVSRTLRDLAAPWIGDAAIVEQSLQRWKFATPTTVLEAPYVAVANRPPLVCCGDAFAGPKVEGAAASGLAAGRWLAETLHNA